MYEKVRYWLHFPRQQKVRGQFLNNLEDRLCKSETAVFIFLQFLFSFYFPAVFIFQCMIFQFNVKKRDAADL